MPLERAPPRPDSLPEAIFPPREMPLSGTRDESPLPERKPHAAPILDESVVNPSDLVFATPTQGRTRCAEVGFPVTRIQPLPSFGLDLFGSAIGATGALRLGSFRFDT
jgi:hypothetical protein